MIERVLELFAAVYAFSTIAFLALVWASKTRADMDELECMKDFDRSCHVWMTPADQGLFCGVARVVGAVMSSAFGAENRVRWP